MGLKAASKHFGEIDPKSQPVCKTLMHLKGLLRCIFKEITLTILLWINVITSKTQCDAMRQGHLATGL